MANNADDTVTIPKHEITALARLVLPSIQQFFESEEGKREFAEWEKLQLEQEVAV